LSKLATMKALLSKKFDNEEILKHVDQRVEAKVLRGDITGLDVPY